MNLQGQKFCKWSKKPITDQLDQLNFYTTLEILNKKTGEPMRCRNLQLINKL